MKGKWLALLVGLLFVLLSYAVEWQGWPVTNPDGLRNIGMVLIFLWMLLGVVMPLYSWRRCPYCPGGTLSPVYLKVVESTVYPGGMDDSGYPLPPIVRRDYVCPGCGYRRVTYRHLRSSARPVYGPYASIRVPTHPKDLGNWWDTNRERAKFHTYQEWLAYYNELKDTEREEMGRRAHDA